MGRTTKAWWNYLSSLAFTAVTVALGIVATPLFLRWLGDERFGAFRAATEWCGHLTLFELGLSGALAPLFARAISRGDSRAVRALLVTGMRSYLGVTALMLVTGAVLAAVIPHLVRVSPSLVGDLRWGCWASLIGIMAMPLAPFRWLAEAGQRTYLVNGLLLLQGVLVTALGLLLAWSGWGIAGQFAAASLGILVFSVLVALEGMRRYFGLRHSRVDDASLGTARREIWNLNWPSLICKLCGRVGLVTDNLLIAYILGPVAVVPFYLTQRLAVLVQGQLQGIGTASWAGLVELAFKGQTETFNRRLIQLTALVAVLGTAILVPIACWNQRFIVLWVGPGCFGGECLTALAAVNGLLLAVFSLWGFVLSGTGHAARVMPAHVVAAVVNLTVSIVATHILGLVGPLVGTAAGFVSVNLWYLPWVLRELFGTSIRELVRAAALPACLGVPYGVCLWWFAHALEPCGWLGLAAEMTMAVVVYLALAWTLVLRRTERREWMDRARVLWPSRFPLVIFPAAAATPK